MLFESAYHFESTSFWSACKYSKFYAIWSSAWLIICTLMFKYFEGSELCYFPEGCRPPSCTKKILEYGSWWFLFRKLQNNNILYIPYIFGLTLRSFYGTSDFSILVINKSKTLTNILTNSQSSATLFLKYLINVSLAFKLRCPKPTWKWDQSCCHTTISRSLYLFLIHWDDLWWQWMKDYLWSN